MSGIQVHRGIPPARREEGEGEGMKRKKGGGRQGEREGRREGRKEERWCGGRKGDEMGVSMREERQ